MPTEQELKEKEPQPSGMEGLSEMQFSAHITEEFSAELPETDDALDDEQEEMYRRDQELLAALDEVLNKSAEIPQPAPERKKRIDLKRLSTAIMKRGAGIVSLAVTLIMMGVALICLLFSGTPDFSMLIKLSPIAAVLLGVEILLSWLASSKKIRIHIPSVCADIIITAGCCIMAVAMNSTITETEQQFSDRSAEAAIYDMTYPELKEAAEISKLTVSVDLNLEGGKKRTSGELTTADDISVDVELNGEYTEPSEFAAECGRVISVFRQLEIPVDIISFSAEERQRSYALTVEGKYQQDFTDEELTKMVHYVFIEDYDYIQDLADFTEETGENVTEDQI